MKFKMMVLILGAGLGIFGVNQVADSQIVNSPADLVSQAARYNCRIREVWSSEKQQWCSQQNRFPGESAHPEKLPTVRPGDEASSIAGKIPEQLMNTEWLLEDLGGAGVIDNLQTTLRFDGNNRIGGQGGCNRYFANMQVGGNDRISVTAIGSTKRLCSPAVMNQESRYFAALQKADRLTLDGSYLLIHVEGLEKPLKFTQLGERR
ncbi:META domain-containing protein [Kovacikia minuta CCNUW1]|uniref:META domain-containing protein n=1 Tax=Kovacikia minuta TaxID=2931930 RepID=UPI001CCE4D6C|nr:META domain-containing protein [Kovacikia minuta]UBF27651.1 META domain-containing protein [Kovacikia minuta CCNUW1]